MKLLQNYVLRVLISVVEQKLKFLILLCDIRTQASPLPVTVLPLMISRKMSVFGVAKECRRHRNVEAK